VLILLPASESKHEVSRGKRLDLDRLSFPPLAPTRAAVLDALIEVSAEPDATDRVCVPASMRDVVRRNLVLRDAPTAAVESVYSGVLYDALGLDELDVAARRRARSWIVIISALWGAVRPGDRIPPYRLNMCGRLPGLAHLPQVWREPLGDVLPSAADRGVIVDCRQAEFATAWRPAGTLAERTVTVKVLRNLDTKRGAGAHSAKHTQGLVVRRIVTDGIDPDRPEELADALAGHFDVEVVEPDRAGRAWRLDVVESLD
jgi:cytoplasmic iron level regulating protein YaaA (DUF328/UPF0246 family)